MKTHHYRACNKQVGIQRVDDIGLHSVLLFSQNEQSPCDKAIFLTYCKKEYLMKNG